jgi:ATP-dependent protease HslVU (ClpYQ) peptidase subunit
MSVVVAQVTPEEVRIAADSQVTRGSVKESVPHSKIFQAGDAIIGSVGYAEEIGLFRVYLHTNHLKEPSEDAMIDHLASFQSWASKRIDNKQYTLNNSYLYAYKGVVFYINGFYIRHIDTYTAIGSGGEVAMGALCVGASVRGAVEAACVHNAYCELPVIEYVVSWPKGVLETRLIS